MLFAPKTGWTNDPNGLIKIDNTYHLFFQYYPDDIVWGPMHWGHAVSEDGIRWEELPIAIYPDSQGYIFSGSAILDIDNISGLGNSREAALLCFYTMHNPDSGEQQQCIAHSTDYINFTKYAQNPVIVNNIDSPDFKNDFRDPKVFVNEERGGYSMVLAAGETLHFYYSSNLLDWEYTGEFDVAKYLGTGICECPDCFSIGDKWILSLSYIPQSVPDAKVQDFKDRHTMNYFVGRFDGKVFIADEGEEGRKMLDYGPDNYAMVSFAQTEEKMFLGWGENWDYVYDIPAEVSRGRMTSMRKATLKDIGGKEYLSFELIADQKDVLVKNGEMLALKEADDIIYVYADEDKIRVSRNQIPETESSKWLGLTGYNSFEAKRVYSGDCRIAYAFNDGYWELLADGGCVVFSVRTS